jgi:hypothetical protein
MRYLLILASRTVAGLFARRGPWWLLIVSAIIGLLIGII